MSRRTQIAIGPDDLVRLLGLPRSADVRSVSVVNEPLAVYVVVSHPDLPDVPQGAEAPLVGVAGLDRWPFGDQS